MDFVKKCWLLVTFCGNNNKIFNSLYWICIFYVFLLLSQDASI